jgi:radical SAM superfamily enzyme YgiQ (UPF0313 family)
MRILILQPAAPRGRHDRRDYVDAVARLGARLRQHGHEPSLLVLSEFEPETLRLKIADVRPEHIIVYLESLHVDLVRRLTEHVAHRYYLPMVIGGPHATVAPHETLSLIGVEGVVLGEWDRAVPEYLEARRLGPDYVGTRGFWFQSEGGLIRNRIAEPERPEEMVVIPDRSLYSAEQIVSARGLVDIEAARGCRFYCAHCQMDLAAGLYEDEKFSWLRRRPVAALAKEIEHLRTSYPALRALRFAGCVFPLDESYLRDFTAACAGPLRVPFTARAKTSELSPELARLLRQAGCYEVELEVLSGSDFIRNEIFQLDLSEEQIGRAFAAAQQAGLRTRAAVQVGLPYDTVVTMEQTGELLRRLAPDEVEAGVFFPLPGTTAHDICRENGWLSGGDPARSPSGDSPLDLPGLDGATIRHYAAIMPLLARGPRAWSLVMRLERVKLGRRTLADLVAPLLGKHRRRR